MLNTLFYFYTNLMTKVLSVISRVFTDVINIFKALKSGDFQYIQRNPFKHRTYEEQHIATALYKNLLKIARTSEKRVSVSFQGRGVHWNCCIEHRKVSCNIHCFDQRPADGAEYLSDYMSENNTVAMGRTRSEKQTISAAMMWVDRPSLQEFYQRFDFVDARKRALQVIEMELISGYPMLETNTRRTLHHQLCDIYDLSLSAHHRCVRFSYYGDNTYPDVDFLWDETVLFRLQIEDIKRLGHVIQQWLCDNVKPSELEKTFPWICVGKLARYYENDQKIVGEFLQSWDTIEQFYPPLDQSSPSEVSLFIRALRAKGYDKDFRAGQSLWALVLSRSRRHGLRPEQPSMAFWFRLQEEEKGMDVYVNGEKAFSLPKIELTHEVEDKLIKLKACAVD